MPPSGTYLQVDEPNMPFVTLDGSLGVAAALVAIVWFAMSGYAAARELPPVTALTPGDLSLGAAFPGSGENET